jgi:hypothetical protein
MADSLEPFIGSTLVLNSLCRPKKTLLQWLSHGLKRCCTSTSTRGHIMLYHVSCRTSTSLSVPFVGFEEQGLIQPWAGLETTFSKVRDGVAGRGKLRGLKNSRVAGLRSSDAPAVCDEAPSAVRGGTFKDNVWWCMWRGVQGCSGRATLPKFGGCSLPYRNSRSEGPQWGSRNERSAPSKGDWSQNED